MYFDLIRSEYERIYGRECILTDKEIETAIKNDCLLGSLYKINRSDLLKFSREHMTWIIKTVKKVEDESLVKEFDIYFVDPDDEEEKHTVVTAAYMGEAVNHVESCLGGTVFRAVMRESGGSNGGISFMHLK